MVHPLLVHYAQEHHPLKLPHDLRGELLLPDLIELPGLFKKEAFGILRLQVLKLAAGKVQVLLAYEPAHIVLPKALKVPVVVGHILGQVGADLLAYGLLYHLHDSFLHVPAVQHLVPLAVDYLALVVHDLVVLQDILAYAEVPALHLALGVLDGI